MPRLADVRSTGGVSALFQSAVVLSNGTGFGDRLFIEALEVQLGSNMFNWDIGL